jgi:hypothetical protein
MNNKYFNIVLILFFIIFSYNIEAQNIVNSNIQWGISPLEYISNNDLPDIIYGLEYNENFNVKILWEKQNNKNYNIPQLKNELEMILKNYNEISLLYINNIYLEMKANIQLNFENNELTVILFNIDINNKNYFEIKKMFDIIEEYFIQQYGTIEKSYEDKISKISEWIYNKNRIKLKYNLFGNNTPDWDNLQIVVTNSM